MKGTKKASINATEHNSGGEQTKMEDGMTFGTSDKAASFGKKPLIKKGYYPAVLIDVKHRKDKDGNFVEKTYPGSTARQIILLWLVYDPNTKKPVTYTDEDQPNVSKEFIVAQVLNSENKKDGTEWRTGFTPNSRITKVFMALGWGGPTGDPIKPLEYLGKWAELNINDYEIKGEDGKTTEASTIESINKLKEEPPTTLTKEQVLAYREDSAPSSTKTTISPENIDKKIEDLKQMKESGQISEEGYQKAVAQLKKE